MTIYFALLGGLGCVSFWGVFWVLIFSTEVAICCRFETLFLLPLLGLGGSGGQHIA